MQEWIESGWKNDQHRFLTRFAVICYNEVERFCCPFYPTFKDLSLRGTNNNGSHEKGGRNLGKRKFFRTFLFSCALYVSSRKAGALRDETSRANEATEVPFSSPEPVVSWSRGRLQKCRVRDENAKIPDQLSRAFVASQ